MENQRRRRELLACLETVKVEVRRTLVHAMGIADPHSQRVAVHLGDELPNLVHIHQINIFVGNSVFYAGNSAQFALHRHADRMGAAQSAHS